MGESGKSSGAGGGAGGGESHARRPSARRELEGGGEEGERPDGPAPPLIGPQDDVGSLQSALRPWELASEIFSVLWYTDEQNSSTSCLGVA